MGEQGIEMPTIDDLTPRQRDVLDVLAEGCSRPEICERLCIAPGTVSRHLENIYQVMHVSGATGAVAWYWRQKLEGARTENETLRDELHRLRHMIAEG